MDGRYGRDGRTEWSGDMDGMGWTIEMDGRDGVEKCMEWTNEMDGQNERARWNKLFFNY
jgi:hypothetical protein